ncbi:holin [Arthrobacter phage Thunderclap]|uniref:Holin n=10 Tax=Amigovirus amigo TaxID=1982100 RepID=A0A0U4IXF7_9CAUD|nr:holin [Arthrobacter phage Amigo]ALY08488.1 hypothetical protein ANANSI_43 [Arthrobacter phage Anansi]ALY09102.1 hypothetical protein GORGEOUS_43 [Arthrobacter phage Gorgeous]ALY10119.1 hypothetical protein RINGS_42 [Arthrobacter phage Rings]ALY10383.1 hypothetical protein SORJUANA_43 [Arthrobacter phage SorJuana]QFG08337.1 hypothetical protein SEA_YEEZUS_42 [Arthrobacter phage Yeezus]QFG13385.1 hypothetical protein SEA_ICHOR_42 [Arthrobacter phage Ichor]QFG13903.1 hypothetical protein SEA
MAVTVPNVETRRYIYTVAAAAAPLLVVGNIIAPPEVDLWLNLAAALLGLPPLVALSNTPKKGETVVITNDGRK